MLQLTASLLSLTTTTQYAIKFISDNRGQNVCLCLKIQKIDNNLDGNDWYNQLPLTTTH